MRSPAAGLTGEHGSTRGGVRLIQGRKFAVATPPEAAICKECDSKTLCRTEGIISKEARG